MRVGQQYLPRPAVVGAAGVDLVPSHLEIAPSPVAADRHLRVAQRDMVPGAEVMVQPQGQPLLHVPDERRERVVAQDPVAVQEVVAGLGQVGQQAQAQSVEHLGGDAVVREGGEGLAGGEHPPAELVPDHLPLVVEGHRLPGQPEALGDVTRGIAERRASAGDRHDVVEVAAPHRLRGQEQVGRRRGVVVIARLVGHVEERAVAPVVTAEELFRDPDRPPQRERALVLAAVGGRPVHRGRREGSRVESRVAVVPAHEAPIVVGAGLGGHVDDPARGLPVFRGEVRGLDGELLHRIGRERDDGPAQADPGVPGAVGQDRRAPGPAAVDE